MRDLQTQLRAYGEQLDTESAPLPSAAKYVDRYQPRLMFGRPWLVVIGTVTAVLLLIGVPLIVLGIMSETPTAEPPSIAIEDTTPATTTTAAPSSTAISTTTTTVAPTTTVGPTTTTLRTWSNEEWEAEGAAAALATADGYYTALNSGDLETAFSLLVDNRPDRLLRDQLRIAVAGANAQFAYECAAEDTPGSILCDETITDDLFGPAGTTNQARVRYHYDAGKLILDPEDSFHQPLACETEPAGDALRFLMDFRVWSAESHPELEEYWLWGYPIDSIGAVPCRVYPFDDPEDAGTVIAIVPEFIAQSDEWPH